jgi:hypothetical protein
MRLIRLPGELAIPALTQSFIVLGAVLVEMDVEDRAPRTGETAGFPLSEGGVATGLMSGL